MKVQVFFDFVAECQVTSPSTTEELEPTRPWMLFVDGFSTTTFGGWAEVILIRLEGFKTQQAQKFTFPVTNNVIEYKVLIVGIKLVKEFEAKVLK